MSDLIIHSDSPFNAETPPDRLRAAFITPQDSLYVRSHGDVPVLHEDSHRLQVGGHVARPLTLSMRQLRDTFAERTVTSVLQCAGNRRSDLHRLRPVSGDPWGVGAIGNAAWTGVALADVLRAAGADTGAGLHVAFEACDALPDNAGRFGVSIPMPRALTPDVLLAFAINGQPLTPRHGFPLRAVVPGFAGVRSAKWLATITVQDHPSDSPIQQTDYKLLPADVTPQTVNWANGMTINEMPLNAAICEPRGDAHVAAGPITVRGYAIANDRQIERVEVSCNGGQTWSQTTLERDPDAPWSWTFWEATINLPPGQHELAVRGWDSAGQTQPATTADTWNFKGYLCTAWHRIRIQAS